MLTGGVRRARAVIVGDGKGWVVAVQEAVLQGVGGLAAIGGGSPAAAGWWVKSGCIFLVYRRGKRKEWVASAGGRQSARIDGAGRVRARRGVLPLQPAAGGWWDELDHVTAAGELEGEGGERSGGVVGVRDGWSQDRKHGVGMSARGV